MFAASQSRTENAADCFATTSWLRECGSVTVEIGSECDCVADVFFASFCFQARACPMMVARSSYRGFHPSVARARSESELDASAGAVLSRP